MADLRISDDLSLPLAVAGEAIGVLATRGAGKSYTSAVLVEELHAAGVQLVVLDPTGVYWGLRSSADGKADGLPLFVLGGAHGDVPLEASAGKLVADVIVDTGQSLILDLSDFDTKAAQTRFVADLVERLYHRKARNRSTLHLIVDEANEFAPQASRYGGDMARLLGAMERAVGKGRSRGLAFTLITQRSAALNKNVLDLIDTLIAMRVLGPRDRKAIADWITDKQQTDEGGVVDSLPKLQTGTAWVWSPVRGILQRVAIRRIGTFDSYRTPEPGEQRVEPAARAPLDVAALGEQMKATAERAKAEDPKALRAQIRDLERQLASQTATAPPEPEVRIEYVERPVLNGQVERLEEVVGELRQIGEGMVLAGTGLAGIADSITAAIGRVSAVPAPRSMPPPPPHRADRPAVAPKPPRDREVSGTLSKAERTVLSVLAEYPEGLTRGPLTILAGYSYSGGFRNTLAALRTAGYIVGGNEQVMTVTDAGLAALGPYEPLPTGRALLDYWLTDPRLAKGEKAILTYLADHYPDSIPGPDLAPLVGYEYSGGFRNMLGKLRTLGLIEGSNTEGVAASGVFF
jgi:uncharacterized protein